MVYLPTGSHPRSINRARRTVTSLIGSGALPLHHAYRLLTLLISHYCTAYAESLKVVSQCFRKSKSSFVTLYCGYRRVIHVERAVHGHRSPDTALVLNYCDVLATDCITDVTARYDWSACHEHRHCVHSLRIHFNSSTADRHHHHRRRQQQQQQQQCDDNHQLTYLQVSYNQRYYFGW